MPRAPKKSESRHTDVDVTMESVPAVAAAADPDEVARGEQPEARPMLPKFAPLTSYEQSGKKLEFRRVRGDSCTIARDLPWSMAIKNMPPSVQARKAGACSKVIAK
jgi:hypothetical protein